MAQAFKSSIRYQVCQSSSVDDDPHRPSSTKATISSVNPPDDLHEITIAPVGPHNNHSANDQLQFDPRPRRRAKSSFTLSTIDLRHFGHHSDGRAEKLDLGLRLSSATSLVGQRKSLRCVPRRFHSSVASVAQSEETGHQSAFRTLRSQSVTPASNATEFHLRSERPIGLLLDVDHQLGLSLQLLGDHLSLLLSRTDTGQLSSLVHLRLHV